MAPPNLKLNTADFEFIFGGHLLLEDGSGGYLLEDGSGYYLLDNYVPQLGDPVAFTNPTWNGRVVSVEQSDITDLLINYQRVHVAATNQAVASATPAAPGDLSDVPAGGYFLLESGAPDRYLLEDGSGLYEQEDTSYGYRNLSVRTSQNQDGTITTYGSLETFETGFAAGQTFKLYSTNLGINGTTYTTTNVTIDFIGANPPTPVYAIEFGDAYQTLQLAGGGVLTRQASTPVQQYGVVMPAGVLAPPAIVTAQQVGAPSPGDLTGLSVTVTVAAGRRLEISGVCQASSSIADDAIGFLLNEVNVGPVIAQGQKFMHTAAGAEEMFVRAIVQPSAGVHTYYLRLLRNAGTGNVTMVASLTAPAYLMVEDIGT